MIHDAIVVGAGLSGLVCARRLVGQGATVRVLEARDRVGGRLWSGTLAGSTIDLGGQWMSVGQPRLAALAAELGIASFPQRREGRTLLDGCGRSPGLFARLATAVAQLRAARRIAKASRAIDVLDPMQTRDAATLDGESLAGYLARTIPNDAARERIAMHADLVLAADPGDLSLLHYLATFRATGGFGSPGPDLPGGGREHRFVGGAQGLALRLAAELGDVIQLDAPVRAIRTGPPCSVTTDGAVERAHRIVLAVPPALAREIDVPLAAPQQAAVAGSRPGPVVKFFAAYERAFWRDSGWSGEAYFPRGAVRATVALADAAGDHPMLLAFLVGPEAARFHASDPGSQHAAILATLGEAFGEPATHPLETSVIDWGRDAWSRGCVAGARPGVLASGARWREPSGSVHVAGTESAIAWPGYMEGAIEAGERAAKEVLCAI